MQSIINTIKLGVSKCIHEKVEWWGEVSQNSQAWSRSRGGLAANELDYTNLRYAQLIHLPLMLARFPLILSPNSWAQLSQFSRRDSSPFFHAAVDNRAVHRIYCASGCENTQLELLSPAFSQIRVPAEPKPSIWWSYMWVCLCVRVLIVYTLTHHQNHHILSQSSINHIWICAQCKTHKHTHTHIHLHTPRCASKQLPNVPFL